MSNLLEQASLVLIPSGYKEDVVYSQIPLDGSGDLAVSRASNGTRVNSAGLVEVCPWNLLQQSETLSVSPWGIADVTITDNSQTAPNGTSTADVLTEGTGTAQHRIYQTTSFSSGIYTVSAYVKNITGTRQAYIDLGPFTAFFTFSTETIYSASGVASFEKLANGWYRISLTSASPITPSSCYIGLGQSGSETYTGNGTSAIAFWGIQYNIGSTAKPYFPTTDRLNVPRLTYQNGGGGCPSLLLEKQSTNLITYSEDFTNAVWLKAGGNVSSPTVTANQITSPDGTQNADKIVFPSVSNTGDFSLVYRNAEALSGSNTTSVYLKGENGGEKVYLFYIVGSTYSNKLCTLTTEWQRFDLTFTGGAVSYWHIGVDLRTGSGQSAQSAQTIYAWGAQLEASSYATSYIGPTTSASATRVADVAIKSSISSLFGASATSFFMDFEVTQASNGGNWTITGYNGTNLFSLCQFDNSNNYPRIVFEGGVDSTLANALTIGRHKIAVSFATNDFRAYIDGSLVLTDTSCTYNRYDRIAVNGTAWTGNTNNNNSFKLNEYAQFPTALTNAELASLTTI
jgi:hypothetical protein